MAKIYHYAFPKSKKVKWDLVLGVIVLLGVLGGYLFLRYESRINTATIDNSQNTPQTQVFGLNTDDTTEVDHKFFTMSLPGPWEEWTDGGGHVEDEVYRYRATDDSALGRFIEVYIDSMPKEVYMTHLLPLNEDNVSNRVEPSDVSDLCRNFADIEPEQIVGVVKARWKGVDFDCDVHRYRFIVGTANANNEGYKVTLGSEDNVHEYYFLYTDHGARPRSDVFVDIIQSFSAR